MLTHPVPAAMDAFLARLRATSRLDYLVDGVPARVRVDDGPPIRGLDDPDAIGIGMTVQDVQAAQGTVQHGYGSRTEQFDVSCAIDSWTGNPDDLASRRVRAYELLAVVTSELAEDPTLAGTVIWARITRHTYRPYTGEDGAGVLLEFAVRMDAETDEG